MRTRLAILSVAALLIASTLGPAAFAYQELELQSATDSLQGAGRTTVDSLFWRSGFGASLLGGPTFAGNAAAYNARAAQLENLTGAMTPNGVRPVFLEFADLASAAYVNGTLNATDYTTQRWNFTNASRATGAVTLGLGAAADAAWAAYLLRTNHFVNGTQDPSGPLLGATAADGLLGLWLVQGLADRVGAVGLYGAFNGTALTAFNLTDPALNDANASNGVQFVPDGVSVLLSSDPEPLFQGFGAVDNASSIAGQASLILGLAEVLALADPAGPRAAIFGGVPFDASLYSNASALLSSVIMNAEATHFDAAAGAYTQGAGHVETGDLALYVRALAKAEGVADAGLKANLTPLRVHAWGALTSLGNANGVFPGAYDVAGPAVTANWSSVTLWSQAAALEAAAAVFGLTGLEAHQRWMFKASAGLESPLFHNGSYHAAEPEPALSTFTAGAVAATVGGLRDLALTGEEPLAIWRLVNATQWLFTAPPLTLSGAQAPPVIGASFDWNATSETYAAGAKDFSSAWGLFAAFEFLTVGPEFYAAVGGGVSVTLRASLLLHNASTSDVGAAIDALDAQVAAIAAELAALQTSFDALNASVSNVSDRLNLSLENETISAQRIADLQANVTALRLSLNLTVANLTAAQADLANDTARYRDLQLNLTNVTNALEQAAQNASTLQGNLNVTGADLLALQVALNTTNATRDAQRADLGRAQAVVALAAIGGIIAGAALMFFVQRFVMVPKTAAQREEEAAAKKAQKEKDRAETEKGEKDKAAARDEDKDNDDDDDDLK